MFIIFLILLKIHSLFSLISLNSFLNLSIFLIENIAINIEQINNTINNDKNTLLDKNNNIIDYLKDVDLKIEWWMNYHNLKEVVSLFTDQT